MTILYEDLSENPLKVLATVFKKLDITLSHLNKSMEALKVDSQQGIFGGLGLTRTHDDSRTMKELSNLFKRFKVPLSVEMDLEDLRDILMTDYINLSSP